MKRRFTPQHRLDLTPAKTPEQLRRDWVNAIRLASACDGACDAATITQLMVALRPLGPNNFPIEAWSARQLATAFLTVARLFAAADVGIEARTACAPVLAAAAEALDTLLSALRAVEAQAWRGQTGERED